METYMIFDLLEGLNEKQQKLNSIIEMLCADENGEFLEEEIVAAEKMLVAALGGHQGHYEYVSSTEAFWKFKNKEMSREVLTNAIAQAIENDWTGTIPVEFHFGS